MFRKIASKVAWVGRTASMVFGLALVLALVVGLASTALSATGGNFILGQPNVADALTRLAGNVDGSAMQVVNNNADADDSALSLSVQSGEAPMRVNSETRVAHLNADKVDGLDSAHLAQGRLSISGSPSQNFGTIVEHFEGFGDYLGGYRKVLSHPPKGNPIDISISCTNQNTLGALKIENKGGSGDSQFVWVDDGSTNPSFTTLSASNFTERPVPTGSENLTIRIKNVISPTRMATIELFTRHGTTGCDANAHALYTFAP